MALEQSLKNSLLGYLDLLEDNVIFNVSVDDSENSKKLVEFVTEIVECSDKLSINMKTLERTPSFSLNKENQEARVTFAGVPLGHEFTSFVLALLQVSGRAPKVDEKLIDIIKGIDKKLDFVTYISLSCHNCPDVVQALNVMSVLNPNITNTMVDGSMFIEEVEKNEVLAVPTVYLNNEEFTGGRISLEQLLEKIVGPMDTAQLSQKGLFDVLVVGGGPAGASAAIYAARKGIKTGIVTNVFGGQPLETLAIENLIGTKYTEGPKLMAQVEEHVLEYNVDIIKNQQVVNIEKKDVVNIELASGVVLQSKSVVVATGAKWRNIGVKNELEFKNKGIAYCPHCDGPMFAKKNVAVVGGGNSGIEAAIDLAGIVNHVTVIEFMEELKADEVLQKRLYSLDNVTVVTNAQTKEINGSNKVDGITYIKRDTNEEVRVDVEGVFILIGLMPNTEWLKNTIDCNERNEIIVDKHGATNVPGVFAAGDCTDSAYKQIIISMGAGATAALGAFDYLIRNT